jgi:hypothetical protein
MGLKPTHLIERQGKTMALYAGLLQLAHEQSEGRLHISTELIQIPNPENGHVAICRCEAKIADENGAIIRSCTGIGDAAPENVGRMVANALIRMSETRSKARALRDLVNVAEAVDEAEDDPREPSGGDVDTTHGKRAEAPKPRMADREFSRQPEAQGLAAAPKTVRQRYAELFERAKRENLVALPLHADPQSTDEQMIEAGRRLQAELKTIYDAAPQGARP